MTIPEAVVIVGAGQAGQQLASALRQHGFPGRISLIGEEVHPPYQRPPLSKGHMAGAVSDTDVYLEEPGFHERNVIELHIGVEVLSIDRAAREVLLKTGERLGYDHLVLATGAQNRQLPPITTASQRVLQLRGLDDASRLRRATSEARDVVIIGGGFIGLEVAATLAGDGRRVQVIERMGRLLDRSVSSILSRAIRQHHEARGVRFHFNRCVATIDEIGGKRFEVKLDDETVLHADAVLSAIGVTPRTALAEKAGLEVGNGILVDGFLTTSDPCISAIGDCCAFPEEGRRLRLESVQNAVAQGNFLARHLTGNGEGRAYAEIPTFWSEQAGLLIQIVGLTDRGDRSILRGDPETQSFSIFRFREDRLTAVESLNRGGDHMLGRRLLAMGISPRPEDVQDMGFDLRSLLSQPA
ncbi:NAD(P)/FAD-dependent oxidoreductase [Paracoccus sp. J55]|uniref:NAD(P)/FAD-dependent oxidoreductase n=1 Tax=Paracoccus sp. J55 TaxID=935849 RepID=UPI00048F50AE|nr:FAD-dependent oxidoreductase [Paracoccus sp. J55]